jgi:hypothetical protein
MAAGRSVKQAGMGRLVRTVERGGVSRIAVRNGAQAGVPVPLKAGLRDAIIPELEQNSNLRWRVSLSFADGIAI